MNNKILIKKAASVIKPRRIKDGLFGDVGCAILSKQNKIFVGVCGASGSNTFCAEKIALGSMVTAGEYTFKKIVAIWKDEKENIFVIPPCGNCRQLMRELDEKNLLAEIILDKDKTVKLQELLPYFDWWKKQ